MITIWDLFTGYDSRIGSGRRAFGSGYRGMTTTEEAGPLMKTDTTDEMTGSWSSRDDYSRMIIGGMTEVIILSACLMEHITRVVTG